MLNEQLRNPSLYPRLDQVIRKGQQADGPADGVLLLPGRAAFCDPFRALVET